MQSIRQIPLPVKLKVLFTGPIFFIGITFFLSGMIFFVVFAANVNFDDMRFSDNDPVTKGKVLAVSSTNAEVNEEPVYEYFYKYNTAGQDYEGQSYGPSIDLPADSAIDVVYKQNSPDISRIKGMQAGIIPIWVLLLVGIFPAIGLIFTVISLISRSKMLKIMSIGQIAEGTLIRQEPTNTRINNRTVYKMVFEFKTFDGQRYEAVGKTHITERLTDESKEMLVYDPQNPAKAVMLDVLPSAVKEYFKNNFFN